MLDDKTRALLGDHEAAKRLTDAGVLVPCPFCGGDTITTNLLGTWWCRCTSCDATSSIRADENGARLAWNTRAQILSAEEMEMLHGKENP